MRALARLAKLKRLLDAKSRNLKFMLQDVWYRDYWVGIHLILTRKVFSV